MTLLALLLALAPCYADRAVEPSLKRAQLATIAAAIEANTTDPAEQGALVSILTHESRACLAVHAGRKRGGHGRGLWQIEPGSHLEPPFDGLGLAATTHAAGQALRLWRLSAVCGRWNLEKRFGLYAGLGCSSWPGAAPRARLARWATYTLTHGK